MTDLIYKVAESHDHNPELRTWYYDDFGNRVDKKTGQFLVLLKDEEELAKAKEKNVVYLHGLETARKKDYDTKPCDTE